MTVVPLNRYKTIETSIGAIINGAFSLLFASLIFGSLQSVPMLGENGLFIDSTPQGLAVGFMCAFFPSFLTRKRINSGQIGPIPEERLFLPKNAVLRAF